MASLSSIFERGVVYADKWPTEVRTALDIADPLTDTIVSGLMARQAVIITGNAGDGKSHLAQQALARLPQRTCLEVTADSTITADTPKDTVIFVRDASALLDDAILRAVRDAVSNELPLLLTINEGPLAGLASKIDGDFFEKAKIVLHARAQGESAPDPEGTLLINLAGRQLTRSEFALRALELVLKNVTPCTTCGNDKSCPRVRGAQMLRKSRRAKERLPSLLALLSSAGHHLSARDIWVFFIDLFFGHLCSAGGDSELVDGYFWTRLFEDDTPLCQALRTAFDPVRVPMPHVDGALWLGNFDHAKMDVTYPGPSPVVAHRDSETLGMNAFASAKRAYFLFGKDVDVRAVVTQHSVAPRFQDLLVTSLQERRTVTRQIVRLLNRYRIASETETELWIARHHGMAAHRRPSAIAASAKAGLNDLELRIPHLHDSERFPDSGYFPDRLLLKWTNRTPTFSLDFATWSELQERRTLAIDREQETVDFAIDLFMAQAPVEPSDDPEIRVYDHQNRATYQLRARYADRGLEIIS